ncbi:MFS transporter [Cellulomonas sp. ICMP 17802]|uniref:MFS transporter n=1 Tax=Cellulomonas sp. ICMP 17802 TaxID=3239199 RepID=UPI00351B6B6A
MYLSLRDRPGRADAGSADEARAARAARRTRVSSVVVTLGVVSMLTDISSESVAAVLPLYLTTALGLSTLAYGFVDGLMQGASALVRIAGGWAADRGDHPKWVAVVGYGLSAVTRGVLLVASSFGAVTAIVAVDRIGKGIRTAPRDAMITASSDPRTLGRSFGVHRTLDTIGAALGPLLAFVILWAIPDGYQTVFVVSFGAAVLGLAALVLLVPDLRPRRAAWLTQHRTREARKLPKCKGCSCDIAGLEPAGRPFSWRFLTEPGLRRLFVTAGVLALLTVGDGFIYLSLQSRDGFATQWFPLLYVGTNIAYMSLALPVGRLADRVGRARVFVWGHVALVAAYVCAGVAAVSAASTIGALLLLGLFYAATDGVLAALVGRRAAPNVRASAIGTAQTVVAVARMASSALFGLLWYTVGRGPAILSVAVLLACAVPVAWFFVRGLDAPSPDEEEPALAVAGDER